MHLFAMVFWGPHMLTHKKSTSICICIQSHIGLQHFLSPSEIRTQRMQKNSPGTGHLTHIVRRGARMLGWCQVWFWCRSITWIISECVALWKTSRWLRWNVKMEPWLVFKNWTLLFLIWSLSVKNPHCSKSFIKDHYLGWRGEECKRVFHGL